MINIYKKNLKIILVVILIFCTFLFSACSSNSNNNGNNNNTTENSNYTTIELSIDNYSQYVNIQQEIISSSYLPYDKIIQEINYPFIKAFQSTKISAIVMKKNSEFHDIKIKLSANTIRNSSGSLAEWDAPSGTLILGYDGSGFVTLNASYDSWSKSYAAPVTYKVDDVSGSIVLLNE